MNWEPVIGLEVHAELSTRTKVFCGCGTHFGAEPNTLICPVCLALPGALPVLNQHALELAVRSALALECRISERMVFERKNYFYPDSPKGYQITQLARPVGVSGTVTVFVDGCEKHIRVNRVQLEEEAGKSIHGGATIREAGFSLEDFNRCGIPLIEIVSEPDMSSVDEARAYLEKLRTILLYIEASDCKMEEGSLRCDVNISLRRPGTDELRPHAEIKNLNSFRAVVNVLEYEIARQAALIESGGEVARETRTWDEGRGVTLTMRRKEAAHDYRYFPEPDLVPLEPDLAWVEQIRSALPELPDRRRRRYVEQYGVPEYDADLISSNRDMAAFFDEAVGLYGEAKTVSNWLMGEVSRFVNTSGKPFAELGLPPARLVSLLKMVDDGKISGKIAKTVLAEMLETGATAEEVVKARGLSQISDQGELEALIVRLVAENPGPAADYRAGKEKALGFFVGQIMKQTGGRANPKMVNDLLMASLGTKD